MAVKVGQEAPDFELIDQDKNPVRLSSLRGKNVVLVFHPLAFTSICEGELCTIRDSYDSYRDADAEVLIVSVDSSAVHRAWADRLGLDFPYLSDFWPHGEVSKTYGVFDENLGIAKRGTFFIDDEGKITDLEINEIPEARDVQSYPERVGALRPTTT